MDFNGLDLSIGTLPRLSNAQTRSISAENVSGAKGQGGMAKEGTGAQAARDLGPGWKISPSMTIDPGATIIMGNIDGPGAIQHVWLTCAPVYWRDLILRLYWDDEQDPSVEVPVGDFFCNGWCERSNVSSLAIAVNPAGGMNSYWLMPFRKSAKITMENRSNATVTLYYQIDYTLTTVPNDVGYFHCEWRRSNPVRYKDVHVLVDGVRGQGHYVEPAEKVTDALRRR